jgi:hypothetical protein
LKPPAFNKKNSGIAPVAIIVVVVIIIAAVGVAAYVALSTPSSNASSTVTTSSLQTATSSGNSLTTGATGTTSVPPPVTTTSSSSSSTTSTPSSTTTASSQSTTSSTTQSVSTTTGNLGYFANVKDLIGNFSQMSIMISSSNSSGTTLNESLSYYVVGTPTINGSQLTEVNFTFTGHQAESQSGGNVSLIIFYNSNGNITLLEENGQNLTGTYAQFGAFVVLPFNLFLSYQQGILKNFSAYANFQNQGTTTETYGHLTLPVTTYTANNFAYQNFTASSATIKLGHLPNSNLEILTLISVTGATGSGVSGTENFSYGLISATPG